MREIGIMSDEQFKEKLNKCLKGYMKNLDELFVSEKDFQIALAMHLKEKLAEDCIEVICEYPCTSSVEYNALSKEEFEKKGQGTGEEFLKKNCLAYIDIMVVDKKLGKFYPIELKYRTKKAKITNKYIEEIDLKNHGAYDAGSYGYLRDVCRINEFKEKIEENYKGNFGTGYAIILTNDGRYLSELENEKSYSAFWIGHEKDKTFNINIGTAIGKVDGKYRKLDIKFDIEMKWKKTTIKNPESELYYIITEVK
ncbi:MAG: hypothetical protein NC393_09990 [Clostridium sp.]|nr:hypothetical protein [Clostridium sp.]MCM1172444.1 hypothetical protein [Clostridium sp.]